MEINFVIVCAFFIDATRILEYVMCNGVCKILYISQFKYVVCYSWCINYTVYLCAILSFSISRFIKFIIADA